MTKEGTRTDASGAVDTSGPSSVPLPLLILGGLALLLLAAGGVGYLEPPLAVPPRTADRPAPPEQARSVEPAAAAAPTFRDRRPG